MEMEDIFRNIAEYIGGEISFGVVGPVGTGKSTFIDRLNELLESLYIKNGDEKESDKIRLVESAGYIENLIPDQEAAEIITEKVITDFLALGLVVTSDGTINNLDRSYLTQAEEKVIEELKEVGKPFLVILNSTMPKSIETIQLAEELKEKYKRSVLPLNCLELTEEDMLKVFEEMIYEFPINELSINLPKWIEALDEHWLQKQFKDIIKDMVEHVRCIKDINGMITNLKNNNLVKDIKLNKIEMGKGNVVIELAAREELFYQVLGEVSGFAIENEYHLLSTMLDLSYTKKEYEKLASALMEVKETGYGVVTPRFDEMKLEEPEIIKHGNSFGVKLKASAPSLHIIRADIDTEITPVIGSEKQCDDLVHYMLSEFEENPQKIWKTEIFGKSIHDLVLEGIQNKLQHMPQNTRVKLQEKLKRIVNEGSENIASPQNLVKKFLKFKKT